MPIIKSAKKRVRVTRRAAVRNAKTKRNLKTALKAFTASVGNGKKVSENHAAAQSALDKAGKKNVMHKNKVARKKRQLAAAAKAQGVKLAGPKKTTKPAPKAPAKKPAAKSPTKKPAAKKPAAKKPAPKKK